MREFIPTGPSRAWNAPLRRTPAALRPALRRAAVLSGLAFLLGAPAATAGTLTVTGTTITYTGVATADVLTVESTAATKVKFYGMTVGQIGAPMPAECTQTNNPSQGQIVICTVADLSHLSFNLGAGDDALTANGLSKETDISGGDGADTIIGGSLADVVNGDAKVDNINAGPGADTINSRDGLADTVNCGNGSDTLTGDTNDKWSGCEVRDLSSDLIADVDEDGYDKPADCDDTNPAIHPGAVDTPGDGIDQDCSGADAVAAPATPTTPTGSGGSGTGSGTPTGGGSGTGSGSGIGGSGTTNTGATGQPATGITTTTGTTGITTTTTTDGSQASGRVGGTGGALIIAATPSITFKLVKARRFTRATKVTVQPVPAGATVQVRCKGPGCPAKRYRRTFKNGVAHLVVRSIFDTAKLRRGAKLEVRVTKPGVIGRAVRYTVNANNVPDSEASCLAAATGLRTVC